MRNVLLILIFFSSFSFAQTGINYQGAATDSQGNKLENQNISLRTSVLQGGVDGTTSYSETHNTTTDQFGLFNVVIGLGEVLTGSFDSIQWGADAHYLKVELDATGGTDYNLVSTTQMMSVPYALYAKNAGLDSASLAEMINELGNTQNYGSNTSNLTFGEFEDITNEVNENLTNVAPYPQYQQNEDGFLYILLNNTYNNSNWFQVNVDSVPINPLGYYYPGNSSMMSLLIPVKKDYFWTTAAYGVTVAKAYWIKFNNYSNNTSTSNLDSAVVTEMITNSGMSGTSKSFKYPDGLNGEYITIQLCDNQQNVTPYTVPEGKTLYVTRSNTQHQITIELENGEFGSIASEYNTIENPLVIESGKTISGYNNSSHSSSINGFLVENSSVTPISTKSEYIVPNNKKLVITNSHGGYLYVNEILIDKNSSNAKNQSNPIIANEGDIINPSGNYCIFNGYLVDQDYFESPSSSSASNSGGGGNSDVQMTVSTFGDTLTIGNQSVIIPGISYENVTPEFGSVTDMSGNSYQTINYGDAGEWMVENLRTQHFSNGESINVIDGSYNSYNYPATWSYADDNSENDYYGKYYNGTAIMDSRNVCPTGWHIPSEAEWVELITFFDGEEGANGCNYCSGGDNLKSDLDWNGNNISYMSIKPYGYLNVDGSGILVSNNAYFWLSDYVGGPGGYTINFTSGDDIDKTSRMFYDFSNVRCKKD